MRIQYLRNFLNQVSSTINQNFRLYILIYKLVHIGNTICNMYNPHLADGTFVDSSFSRNAPFIFKLGAKEVIAGMVFTCSYLSGPQNFICNRL